jgi:hypothetical protein
VPAEISTSYAERSNLSLRMASRRFTRLTNGFSKKLENHAAAVSLYVAHYMGFPLRDLARSLDALPPLCGSGPAVAAVVLLQKSVFDLRVDFV